MLQEHINFVCGPQLPIGNTYFDRTQLEMAKKLGEQCPVAPPSDPSALEDYHLHLQYYDLPKSEYIVYERTKDEAFRSYGRKCADSYWQHPWINKGTQRDFYNGRSASPRHGNIGGLILRALDGKPEYWDFIVAYVQAHLNIWLLMRLASPKIHIDVREGAFVFHYAVWLAHVLPNSYPLQSGGMATNGAAIRAQLHADLEKIVLDYYVRLQKPCGCWVYDVKGSDGTLYLGITQPFTLGLLLLAFADFHQITTNTTVRDKLKEMILKTSRHLYSDGPYRKDDRAVYDPNVRLRFFWYTYHGGTAANPTMFEKGGDSWPGNTQDQVRDGRQSIGPVISIYGYAYKISNDPFYFEALRELWDAAYGETDGIKTYFNTDGKGFNQHCARAGSGPAWAGLKDTALLPPTVPQPTPAPNPTPAPDPKEPPMPTPSPDGTKGRTITDNSGNVWTIGSSSGAGPILLNGKPLGGGAGSELKFVSGIVYVLGTDSPQTWWTWDKRWVSIGPKEPGVVATLPNIVVETAPTDDTALRDLIVKRKSEGYAVIAMVFQRA